MEKNKKHLNLDELKAKLEKGLFKNDEPVYNNKDYEKRESLEKFENVNKNITKNMKTPEEVLDEVIIENKKNVNNMLSTKELVLLAMKKYAKLYHENEINNNAKNKMKNQKDDVANLFKIFNFKNVD